MGCKGSKHETKTLPNGIIFNVDTTVRKKIKFGLKIGKDENEGYEANILAGCDSKVTENFSPVLIPEKENTEE